MTPLINSMAGANVMKDGSRVNILDESVLSGLSRPYKLLFSVDHSFLGLSVIDQAETKFVGLEAFHFPKPLSDDELADRINSISRHSTILKKIDFRSVSVQVCNRLFTLVPKALFKPGDAAGYLRFNQKIGENSQVLYENTQGFELANVFAMPDSITQALKNIFERYTIHHHLTSLLESTKIQFRNTQEKALLLNVHSGQLNIIVTEGRKLLLCNAYGIRDAEDAAYFVLFACEQLGLNPDEVKTFLTGEVERESALGNLLFKYIRNIRMGERLNSIKFTYGFEELPHHYYYSVFSHILCES